VGLGLQQKRAQAVYLYRDSRNNFLNPTSGSRLGSALTFTGGFLGGNDHYLEFSPEAAFYYSPFNLPFLKNHPCVFEIRANGTFMLPPVGNVKQDYTRNEWISSDDRLRLGGPETLRIWGYYDRRFPLSWGFVGLYHRITYGFEFRVPIHPQMLWLAFFTDAGSLWSDPYWEKQIMNTTYRRFINNDKADGNLYDLNQFFDVNLLEYFKYSYGVGFRIQIPMMPLRFWFGRRAIYDGDKFIHLGGIDFTFQIGDFRY
jgi:outer membrane protein insertion porin family